MDLTGGQEGLASFTTAAQALLLGADSPYTDGINI